MEPSRGIGIYPFLFAAGTLSGTFFPTAWPLSYGIAASLVPLLTILLLLTLLLRNRPAALLFLGGTIFCCGIFCSLSASFPGGSGGSSLPTVYQVAGERMKALIRSVPFRDPETSHLLTALLCGDRSGLSRETVGAFRKAGASHLLALSGLHIGILYMILSRLLEGLGHSPAAKTVKTVLILLTAGFYTVMTGASPSMVRAFLFIVLHEMAQRLHRKAEPLRILCAALTVQLIFSPLSIRSVGFQLSYAAMLGIVLLFPILYRWYPSAENRPDPIRKIWEAAALSLSCQIPTAPLSWLYFKSFPVYFLLTNLLAIPLTTLLVTSSLVTLFLSSIRLCPEIFISITNTLSETLRWTLDVIAAM